MRPGAIIPAAFCHQGVLLRHYELVVVLSPMISPDEASQAWERIKGFITTREAEIVHEERWGTRRLAYPVKKGQFQFLEGNYHLTRFAAEGSFNRELENFLKLDDNVLRSLVTITLSEEELASHAAQTRAPRPPRAPAGVAPGGAPPAGGQAPAGATEAPAGAAATEAPAAGATEAPAAVAEAAAAGASEAAADAPAAPAQAPAAGATEAAAVEAPAAGTAEAPAAGASEEPAAATTEAPAAEGGETAESTEPAAPQAEAEEPADAPAPEPAAAEEAQPEEPS